MQRYGEISDKVTWISTRDFMQKVRYAYGYNTETPYEFLEEEYQAELYGCGRQLIFVSLNLDSADLVRSGSIIRLFLNAGEAHESCGSNGKIAVLYSFWAEDWILIIIHFQIAGSSQYILTFSPS